MALTTTVSFWNLNILFFFLLLLFFWCSVNVILFSTQKSIVNDGIIVAAIDISLTFFFFYSLSYYSLKCLLLYFGQHLLLAVGPLIGEHYVSRYYGTIDIPEAGTYEFCAHANAGYHYVGMDMVKQGGTKHPGPYGQTLIGFDAGKYSKRRCEQCSL